MSQKQIQDWHELREEATIVYGTVCSSCGKESNPIVIHHIFLNGNEERDSLGGSLAVLRKAVKSPDPECYCVLCQSCHAKLHNPKSMTEAERREQKRRWYLQNRERIHARQKQYRLRNKDELAAKSRAYYISHRQQEISRRQAYHRSHQDEDVARAKRFYESHIEERKCYNAQYYQEHKRC